jgi:glycosyltransferase involved in cell wall biosynthesis
MMIEAFRQAAIPQARLVLVGDGPCRTELEAQAGERVIFAGLAPKPEEWYAAMDVFCLSSMTEQMPVSLLEAMACGLPALCTNVGDVSDMLGATAPPTVTPPGDATGYAHAMRMLAASPALRAELGAANRKLCTANYSLSRMVAAYAEVYRAAAGVSV